MKNKLSKKEEAFCRYYAHLRSPRQADVLTTELEHYRRILTPVIEKICATHLYSCGYTGALEVVWDDITLKDTLDEANAAYLNAKTQQINQQLNSLGGEI